MRPESFHRKPGGTAPELFRTRCAFGSSRLGHVAATGTWSLPISVARSRYDVQARGAGQVAQLQSALSDPFAGVRCSRRGATGGILLGMPMTTIKVDTATRDRLLAEARREGRTLGRLLEDMLAERERAQRFADLKRAIAATPAAEHDTWAAETAAFDTTSSDGGA